MCHVTVITRLGTVVEGMSNSSTGEAYSLKTTFFSDLCFKENDIENNY